mmetsp:Transcript_23923/g.60940  ORF Transcript_23923/g.60940 Transcript_23923/m.60940 type:complete len:351 (-) Transcript_23923:1316-2368(-)
MELGLGTCRCCSCCFARTRCAPHRAPPAAPFCRQLAQVRQALWLRQPARLWQRERHHQRRHARPRAHHQEGQARPPCAPCGQEQVGRAHAAHAPRLADGAAQRGAAAGGQHLGRVHQQHAPRHAGPQLAHHCQTHLQRLQRGGHQPARHARGRSRHQAPRHEQAAPRHVDQRRLQHRAWRLSQRQQRKVDVLRPAEGPHAEVGAVVGEHARHERERQHRRVPADVGRLTQSLPSTDRLQGIRLHRCRLSARCCCRPTTGILPRTPWFVLTAAVSLAPLPPRSRTQVRPLGFTPWLNLQGAPPCVHALATAVLKPHYGAMATAEQRCPLLLQAPPLPLLPLLPLVLCSVPP